ncbi:MAG: glycoside hydrolase family 30 protein [Terriglobales bacterium]
MNRRQFCRLAALAPWAAAPSVWAGSGPLLDRPPLEVRIDAAVRGQEMAGFGASGAFHMADVLRYYPAGDRARILDLLFSPTRGAGLSVVRNIIPPEDGRQAPILSRSGQADWNSDAGQIWLMRQAARRGCTRFISSAWTPPPWMKTNGALVGGRLRPDCYAAYADYLAAYVAGYRRQHGLEVYAVSPQNEPDVTVKYASCAWNGEEFRRFVASHLGPLWRRRRLAAQIMLGENSEWSEAPAVPSLQDAAAREAVGIVASHAYSGDNHVPEVGLAPRTGVLTLARRFQKPIWQTEVSAFNANDPGMDDALYWARLLHFHLAEDGVSGWLYWWLISPSPNREALIHLDLRHQAWQANKRLFALGQYSRFVRPGAARVAATANPAPRVLVSAYRLGRQLSVVVINAEPGAAPARAEFQIAHAAPTMIEAWRTSGAEDIAPAPAPLLRAAGHGMPPGVAFTVTLAPRSLTTFVLR